MTRQMFKHKVEKALFRKVLNQLYDIRMTEVFQYFYLLKSSK